MMCVCEHNSDQMITAKTLHVHAMFILGFFAVEVIFLNGHY